MKGRGGGNAYAPVILCVEESNKSFMAFRRFIPEVRKKWDDS